MPKREPNFIVGGTSAGGTSFLATTIVQHPQIYLPKEMRPEPHYYYKSWEYEKGHDYYLERWFSDVPEDAIAVGERSSSYMFGAHYTAEKVQKDYPNMKFIFTLRNPIERAWANYRYSVLQGVDGATFEEALNNEQERIANQEGIWAEIQPYNYTGRGLYAEQIKAFYEYFPKENFLFVKSEDLSKNTEHELRRVYEFLGLTQIDFKHEPQPAHTSVNVLNPALQKELRDYFEARFDKIIEAIRRHEDVEPYIENEDERQKVEALRGNMVGDKMPMPEECRSYLQDYFKKDMAELEELVHFDVADWK